MNIGFGNSANTEGLERVREIQNAVSLRKANSVS